MGRFTVKAANYSWQLAVLTIVLVVLSSHVRDALVVIEIVSLIAIIFGVICGIIGLCGIPRHGVKKVLLPSLAGLIINGLLLLIFMNNFMAAYTSSRSPDGHKVSVTAGEKHIGTWEALTPKGQKMRWVILEDRIDMSCNDGPVMPVSYEIDSSKKPVWLTITMKGPDGSSETMPLIIEFTGPGTMRVLGPAQGSNERPAGFSSGAEEEILEFKKQPDK